MTRFSVQGVVRNGQVVLEVPLNLPDGTVVTVTNYSLAASEEYKRNLLTVINRLDLMDDPDWQAKAEPERVARTEKLILEMAGMWAGRPEMADPEAWLQQRRSA
jgi:hypothetical protein